MKTSRIRLNESQLRELIRESVRNVLMEMDEIAKDKVMPGKYMQIFKNRIENAMACSEDMRKTVTDFYRDFRNRIPNEAFTIGNLMDIADGIETSSYRTHETSDMPDGHKIKNADGWWGANAGKFLEEDSNDFEYKDAYRDNRTGEVIQSRRGKDGRKHYRTVAGKKGSDEYDPSEYKDAYVDKRTGETIQSRMGNDGKKHYRTLKENAFKSLVNEISSEKWAEISNSIHKNYGGADFPGPKATRFDEYGNPIYGKKGKTVASLYRKLDAAKKDAFDYERANSPESEWDEKAIQITYDYEPDEEETEYDGGWSYIYDTWNNIKTEDGVWPRITLTLKEGEPHNV